MNRNQQEFLSFKPAHRLFPRMFPILCSMAIAFFPLAGSAEDQTSSQTAAQAVQQPSDVAALMGLLETQLRKKQSVAAQQSVQKLTSLLSPKDPRFFQLASLCASHEDYTTAIPLMEKLRETFPQSYDVNYNLSLAYLRNKSYAKAAETLQTLLRNQPKAEAYNLLAIGRGDSESTTWRRCAPFRRPLNWSQATKTIAMTTPSSS